MTNTHRFLTTVCAGLLLAALDGCQTVEPGSRLTLPSGQYLKHDPIYIPPSPAFPLSRELTSQEEAAAKLAGGNVVGGQN